MTKEELLDIIKKLLNTETDFSFLLQLTADELKILVVTIRERIDRMNC